MEKIKIRLKEDLSEEFKNEWRGTGTKDFMVKGWETWVSDVLYKKRNFPGTMFHPENNRYAINFPVELFEEIKD